MAGSRSDRLFATQEAAAELAELNEARVHLFHHCAIGAGGRKAARRPCRRCRMDVRAKELAAIVARWWKW